MRKVLVIRLSSLGDVVLTAPVFRALRQAWPDARLTALVKEDYADVLAANPDVDERLLLHRGESILSLIRRVRQARFDVVIDLHGNLRSRLVSLFCGAPRCVRYKKAALARRLYVAMRKSSPDLEAHTLDRYMQTLSALGIVPALRGPERLVVIQTAFLGDAVLTTPLLAALHESHPATQISVVCTPEVAEVFQRQPGVSEIILFDKRGNARSVGALWRLARDLRARNFNAAILPHRSFRSALLSWLARIPRRIGFTSSQGRWLLTDRIPFLWDVHDAERNVSLLQALGVKQAARQLRIQPEPQAQRIVQDRLRAAGINDSDRLLGINAGSVWPTKRWLPEGFAAVADRASRELGAKVIFFGGHADEKSITAVLEKMKEKAVNWAGQTTMRELIAAIARCDTFLTNDSGPMHIAVATQVPTVAIFGPTTKELGFFPYGEGHTVIEKNLSCRPCGLHGANKCPLGHFECMKTISPEEVFQAVARYIAGSPRNHDLPAGATA